MAKEKGLEPLAALLFAQERDCPRPEEAARDFVDPEKGVETVEDALQGASDIIAEQISDDAAIRKSLRALISRQGQLVSRAATEDDSVYRLYYDFTQSVARLQGHQVLAINRGEKEGILKVSITLDREQALPLLRRAVVKPGSAAMEFVKSAAEDAYDRLIFPSLEREVRNQLTEQADEGAIGQFALNLKPLLMQPPVKGKVTMGLDPGYRMGCKVAVVDGTGKVLDTAVVYPTYGERQKNEAIAALATLIKKHGVEHIAIGNGTASRETEQMAVELIRQVNEGSAHVSYMIVSEAGASVYSASKLAAEEFPQYDVNLRSAVSIARRLQDPLAERPQGHRRGAVSARHAAKAARRGAERRGRGLRQRRRRGYQHGVAVTFAARCGPERHNGEKCHLVPRGERRVHLTRADQKSAKARPQGLPAVRRLPARAGEQERSRQHRRPPREL